MSRIYVRPREGSLAETQHDRLLRIDQALRSKCEERCTASALARELGCSDRTIRRDIEYIQREYGLRIEYDRTNGRYRYLGNPPPLEVDLPTTIASKRDRFALLLSLLATEQFRGTAIFKRLREMHERLLSELPTDERGEYDKAAKRVRFLGPPVPEIDERIWNILIDSLIDPETLKLTYQTGHSGNLTTRHLDPYCLIARARDWMVVGHDHQHNEIRTFLLRRIKNLEGTGDLFDYPADFDVDKYFADAFDGDQSTGPTYHVKLRFAKENAQHGREFLSNSTQKITECKDGSVIVEFGTRALYRVVREVLAWGGKARVLGPPELIECTHSAVRNLKTCVTRRGICKSVA